jgi:hypothetical protein
MLVKTAGDDICLLTLDLLFDINLCDGDGEDGTGVLVAFVCKSSIRISIVFLGSSDWLWFLNFPVE